MPGAAVAAAAAAPDAAAEGPPAAGGRAGLLNAIGRMAFMWFMMSYLRGSTKPAGGPAGAAGGGPGSGIARPTMQAGARIDLYAFIGEQPTLTWPLPPPLWSAAGLELATFGERTANLTVDPTPQLLSNGTLFLHLLVSPAGAPLPASAEALEGRLPAAASLEPGAAGGAGGAAATPDDAPGALPPLGGGPPPPTAFVRSHSLVAHLMERKEEEGVHLLGGGGGGGGGDAPEKPAPKAGEPPAPKAPRRILAHWRENVTINVLDYFTPTNLASLPPAVSNHFQLNDAGDFHPLVVFNDFWTLKARLAALNESVAGPLNISLTVKPLSFWWWQLQQQMEQSFAMQQKTGIAQEGDSEDFKKVLIEGNPVLLSITFAVSLLHSVFDFLAFKNDIGFWKNNKSMEGLAARSIVINAGCQIVIFLYLLDNDTSMVVLFSSGVGAAIEVWKVTKAMDVSVDRSRFPYIHVKGKVSADLSDSNRHDADATRYLSYALYPCIIGYSLYSLYYKKHRSWYNWLLSSAVGAVYTFGFILMCPQLYLNWKLKSVAHLPWRQMTYKFLNTIIDDLFAFVITMPTLHRLSVFRDDLVFLVFLYQRWIYRVDKTRVNEFGFSGEEPAGGAAAVDGAAPAAPALLAGAAAGAAAGEGGVRQRKADGGKPAAAGSSATAAAGDAGASGEGEGKKSK